ncbi:MAG: hypothetical protein P1U56_20930 [Saprospiraceae bacterium]|nr:hypothetical protein [Saprospiraceae bacterium]
MGGGRKSQESERIPIANFSDLGTGIIKGKISPSSAPLIAPLSGRPCVAFWADAFYFEGVDENKLNNAFINVASENGYSTLIIEDETGQAEINLEGVDYYAIPSKTWKTSLTRPMNGKMKDFLRKHGKSVGVFAGMGTMYKFEERIIEVGQNVYIEGQGKWTKSIDGHKNIHPKTLLMEKSDQYPLKINDY